MRTFIFIGMQKKKYGGTGRNTFENKWRVHLIMLGLKIGLGPNGIIGNGINLD